MDMDFKFIERKCDVEREKRIRKILEGKVTSTYALELLNEELKRIEVRHGIENYVTERIMHDIDVETKISQNGKKVYKLKVKYISDCEGKYAIYDGVLSVQMVGENYAESWRNIGADYHWIHLEQKSRKGIDYWHTNTHSFLLEQLLNQDKLDEICDAMNLLKKNYLD